MFKTAALGASGVAQAKQITLSNNMLTIPE